jgi:hypothetical protein
VNSTNKKIEKTVLLNVKNVLITTVLRDGDKEKYNP